jgi:sugar phosphate isomerase/epimerase
VVQVERGHAHNRSLSGLSTLQNNRSARQPRRRREHLRHIRPLSRERQLAKAADARVLTMEPDREWTYGDG